MMQASLIFATTLVLGVTGMCGARPAQRAGCPSRVATAVERADTTWYGDYQRIDGVYYARSGGTKQAVAWTFDRGNGPHGDPDRIEDGEGWKAVDLTRNAAAYFRLADASLNLGNGVPPPILHGAKSLWVGVDKPQADSLCWECGAGYGNGWRQRAISPPFAYNGTGDVSLRFAYFNKSEPCLDGTQVYLRREDNTELLLNARTDPCSNNPAWVGTGGFTDSIGSYRNPAVFQRLIPAAEIGGPQDIRIVLEFTSDLAWSDEDCRYPTIWGPFGCDDLTVSGGGIDASYDFEQGLEGWTPAIGAPTGSYAGIADVGCYSILDPCRCKLAGNVLEMHNGSCDAGVHPSGQHEWIESPICDLGDASRREIFMEFDAYAILPLQGGVSYRPGWRYYPWTCDVTGQTGWSPRVGSDGFYYLTGPVCQTNRYSATSLGVAGTPVPPNARKVIAILELTADGSAFSIPPGGDTGNATPLIDNIAVGAVPSPRAPSIAFDTGGEFRDAGSYPGDRFDPRAPGPANTDLDRNSGTPDRPVLSGDSLVVVGPQPGNDPNNRWEARMWWRVARRAPFQSDKANGVPTTYQQWKNAVSKGLAIDRPDRPQFTWGWMDSVQVGPNRLKYKFDSYFREDDASYNAPGESARRRAMLWDDVFFPGTRIEYFATADYVSSPSVLLYLPDTTGGNFREFEILPGCREANVPNCGGAGFNVCVYHPATLFVRMADRTNQKVVENALRTVLNGLPPCDLPDGCAIPADRNWDRYDYGGGCACYSVPFGRGILAGSNNGMTLDEILGYRAILVGMGGEGVGNGQEADWKLLDEWLTASDCSANANRQVLMMNGDKVGEALEGSGPEGQALLRDRLSASVLCNAFNGTDQDSPCPPVDESFCVRYLPAAAPAYPPDADVDAFGNGCPYRFGFDVYSLLGAAAGNRLYHAEDGLKEMSFAQVVNEDRSPGANYRTILDGVSWDHMTVRDPAGQGNDACPRDLTATIGGALAEIGPGLRWGYEVLHNTQIPKLTSVRDLATCEGTWNLPAGIEDGSTGIAAVNRLYPNEPNPFHPRTTIRFSLARRGPVQIVIYDVSGRQVRLLENRVLDAGSHAVVWDGTNDLGKAVGSGVYWSQMRAGAFVSTRKVIPLR